jgi:glucose/mannose-6-phosphate isomerase
MKQSILDEKDKIYRNDPENMILAISELSEQVSDTWQKIKNFIIPAHYLNISKVVVAGIGGSAIGTDMIIGYARENITKPIELVRDYNLPGYVDNKTLVIVSSYSGNTEETLSCFKQAYESNAKIIGVAHAGELKKICENYKIPFFKIDYDAQPRAASPSSFIAIAGILNKLGIISILDSDIENTCEEIKKFKEKIDINISVKTNQAKILAEKIHPYIPFIIGSGSLFQVAHKFKISINENAKQLAFFEAIPEMNHNTMTGLEFPDDLGKKIYVIILQSVYDHPRNKLRQRIMLNILNKRKIKYDTIMIPQSSSMLSEMFMMLELTDYVSYYLALLNSVDPTPVEIVEYFKNQIKKEV